MTTGSIIEVAVAVVVLIAGIVLYRKGAREDSNHGSQGAVLLFFVAAIMLIHGFGLLEYRPSPGEMAR